MKPTDAVAELKRLLKAGERLGAPAPSSELTAFLNALAELNGNKPLTSSAKGSAKRPRVGRKRPEADVSKTIEELAQQLRNAFRNADEFEEVLARADTQGLTKPNVVQLFARTFQTQRKLPAGMKKSDLFNAFRRERINRVRTGA